MAEERYLTDDEIINAITSLRPDTSAPIDDSDTSESRVLTDDEIRAALVDQEPKTRAQQYVEKYSSNLPQKKEMPWGGWQSPNKLVDKAIDLGKGAWGVVSSMVDPVLQGESALLSTVYGRDVDLPRAFRAKGWFNPDESSAKLSEYYSPSRQEAESEIQQAEGFTDTAKAYVTNPDVIAGRILESLPWLAGMLYGSKRGAVIALDRGFAAGLRGSALQSYVAKWSRIYGGAAEGASSAMGISQAIGQGNLERGEDFSNHQWLALPAGVAVALTSLVNPMEADIMSASIRRGTSGKLSEAAAKAITSDVRKEAIDSNIPVSLLKSVGGATYRMGRSGFKEGVLEEGPQNIIEQGAQNIAEGKPFLEGAGQQYAEGAIIGGAMGLGMHPFTGNNTKASPASAVNSGAQQAPTQQQQAQPPVAAAPQQNQPGAPEPPPTSPAAPTAPANNLPESPVDQTINQVQQAPQPAQEQAPQQQPNVVTPQNIKQIGASILGRAWVSNPKNEKKLNNLLLGKPESIVNLLGVAVQAKQAVSGATALTSDEVETILNLASNAAELAGEEAHPLAAMLRSQSEIEKNKVRKNFYTALAVAVENGGRVQTQASEPVAQEPVQPPEQLEGSPVEVPPVAEQTPAAQTQATQEQTTPANPITEAPVEEAAPKEETTQLKAEKEPKGEEKPIVSTKSAVEAIRTMTFPDITGTKKRWGGNKIGQQEFSRRVKLIEQGEVPDHLKAEVVGEENAKVARYLITRLKNVASGKMGRRLKEEGGVFQAGAGISQSISRARNLLAAGHINKALDQLTGLQNRAAAVEGKNNLKAALDHTINLLVQDPHNEEAAANLPILEALWNQISEITKPNSKLGAQKWQRAFEVLRDNKSFRLMDDQIYDVKFEEYGSGKEKGATSDEYDDSNIRDEELEREFSRNEAEQEELYGGANAELQDNEEGANNDKREDFRDASEKWRTETAKTVKEVLKPREQEVLTQVKRVENESQSLSDRLDDLKKSSPEWVAADKAMRDAKKSNDKQAYQQAAKARMKALESIPGYKELAEQAKKNTKQRAVLAGAALDESVNGKREFKYEEPKQQTKDVVQLSQEDARYNGRGEESSSASLRKIKNFYKQTSGTAQSSSTEVIRKTYGELLNNETSVIAYALRAISKNSANSIHKARSFVRQLISTENELFYAKTLADFDKVADRRARLATTALTTLWNDFQYSGSLTKEGAHELNYLFNELIHYQQGKLETAPGSYTALRGNFVGYGEKPLKAMSARDLMFSRDKENLWAKKNAAYLLTLSQIKRLPINANLITFAVDPAIPLNEQAYFTLQEDINGIPRPCLVFPTNTNAVERDGPQVSVHELIHAKDRQFDFRDRKKLDSFRSWSNRGPLAVAFIKNKGTWNFRGKVAKAVEELRNKHPIIEEFFAYPYEDFSEETKKINALLSAVRREESFYLGRKEGVLHDLVNAKIRDTKRFFQQELYAQLLAAHLTNPAVATILKDNEVISEFLRSELYGFKERAKVPRYTGNPEIYYVAPSRRISGRPSGASFEDFGIFSDNEVTPRYNERTVETTTGELERGDDQRLSRGRNEKSENVRGPSENRPEKIFGNAREIDQQASDLALKESAQQSQGNNPPPPPPPGSPPSAPIPPTPPTPPFREDAITRWLETNFKNSRDPMTAALGSKLISAWKQINHSVLKANLRFLAPAWKIAKIARNSIPTVDKLMEAMANHTKEASKLLEVAHEINDKFQTLTKGVQNSINTYLYDATMANEWGYIPEWMSETQKKKAKLRMTDERIAEWNKLSDDAKDVIDRVYKHEYDNWMRRKKLLNDLRSVLLAPRITRTEKRIDALNKSLAEAQGDKEKTEKLTTELKAAERTKAEFDDLQNRLNKIDEILEKEEVLPYAPLRRNGRYAMVYKSEAFQALQKEISDMGDQEGLTREQRKSLKDMQYKLKEMMADPKHYHVEFTNSMFAADQLKQQWEAKGGKAYAFERQQASRVRGLSLADRAEIGELVSEEVLNSDLAHIWFGSDESAIKAANLVMDALNQVFERAASEVVRDSSTIERRRVSGADPNMFNSFLQQSRVDAAKIANLTHSRVVAELMAKCREEAKEANRKGDHEAMTLLDEIESRYHESISRELPDTMDIWIEHARAYTTFMQLLTRPAYYIQNATQPMMMTFPELAGVFGGAKSMGTLTKAYGDLHRLVAAHAKKNKISIADAGLNLSAVIRDANLPEDTKKMFEAMSNTGLLDLGKETDFGTIEVTGVISKHANKAMSRISRLARSVEIMNRFVSAKAAYDLYKAEALKKGMSEEEAIAAARKYANDVVAKTQGDYSASSAPNIFNGKFGKLGLQFRKFQLFQYAWFTGMVHDAFGGKDVTPAERSAARRQLGYAMITHGFFGLKGLPGAALAFMLADAVGGSDDGEDYETTLRKQIGDPDLADLILEGIPSYLLRLNMSGMVGAGEMLSLTPYAKKEITDVGGLEAAAVAMLGPFLSRMFRGGDYAAGGNWNAMLDTLILPNGISSARHVLDEGYSNPRTGEQVLTDSDFHDIDRVWQSLGFQPKAVEEMYAMKNALTKMDKHYTTVKADLANMYKEAKEEHDADKMREFRDALKEVNSKRKTVKLPPWTVNDFVKRERNKQSARLRSIHGANYTSTNKKYLEDISKSMWRD